MPSGTGSGKYPRHMVSRTLEGYMPSLIRFIFVLAVLGGMISGSLYVLAVYFEPDTKEISKPLRNLKLKRI